MQRKCLKLVPTKSQEPSYDIMPPKPLFPFSVLLKPLTLRLVTINIGCKKSLALFCSVKLNLKLSNLFRLDLTWSCQNQFVNGSRLGFSGIYNIHDSQKKEKIIDPSHLVTSFKNCILEYWRTTKIKYISSSSLFSIS